MKFLIAFLFFSLSFETKACDCDSIRGFKDADVVFKGKVLNVQRVEEPYIRYEITFKVSSWRKGGKQARTIVVDTPCLVDGCCGIGFQTGDWYEVYAYKEDKRLKTSQCWATRKIKQFQ